MGQNQIVELPGVRHRGIRVQGAHVSKSGRRWARIQRIRKISPGRHNSIPPWQGRFRIGRFGSDFSVSFRIDSDKSFRKKLVRILAVGSDRRQGERILTRFLEHGWQAGRVPIVLLSDDGSDDKLLKWCRSCFPNAIEARLGDDDLFTPIQMAVGLLPRPRRFWRYWG